jgi:hypothetical protein
MKVRERKNGLDAAESSINKDMNKTKTCGVCGCCKTVDMFYRCKTSKDGLQYRCKTCEKAKAKKYYSENKEEKSRYYSENKEKYQERYKKNWKDIQEKNKEYYNNHREEIAEYKKKWTKENKSRLNQKRREKLRNDPQYRAVHNLRSRLHSALNTDNKSISTLELIGCDKEYLTSHLESQFTEGMSWDNYGDWHIDHIRPCASFDLTDMDEQKKCFHFSNLQPLWATDNLSKGSKYDINSIKQ